MDNRKGFSTVFFTMAFLLICCNPASSFVNQTTVQQPTLYKQWSYFSQHPIPAGVPSISSQFDENVIGQQVNPIVDPLMSTDDPILPRQATCGRGPLTMPARSLISERVGGTDSSLATNPWPFLVNLKGISDPAGVFFCSGSLISDLYVLIAAQCLANMSVFGISGVTVWIGQTNQNGPLAPTTTRRLAKVIIHSKYNPSNYANDIALIRMDRPVIFSKTVGPVCLPPANSNANQHAGMDAVIMGWGPEMPGAASTSLRHGRVKIDTMSICFNNMPSSYSVYLSHARNICVVSQATLPNKFSCSADVGGPVVINTAPPTPGAAPIWTQVGINSYTQNCGSHGIKPRVSAYRTWIDQTIASGRNSKAPTMSKDLLEFQSAADYWTGSISSL